MTNGKIILPLLLLALCGCTKSNIDTTPQPLPSTPQANGLPEKPAAINGYISVIYRATLSNPGLSALRLYAAFGDPARNLMASYNHYTETSAFGGNFGDRGNISVGDAWLAGYQLLADDNFGYSYIKSSPYVSFSTNTALETEGNGSFKPLDLSIARGFPVIGAGLPSSYTFNTSGDFVIETGSHFSNYDSLTVMISTDFSNTSIQKTVLPGTGAVVFAQAEIARLQKASIGHSISFQAFNYSHITVEGKTYLFELSRKADKSLVVVK